MTRGQAGQAGGEEMLVVADDDVDEGAGVYGKEGHGGGDKRGTGGAYGRTSSAVGGSSCAEY